MKRNHVCKAITPQILGQFYSIKKKFSEQIWIKVCTLKSAQVIFVAPDIA